jgi:uracil-DNA glycosylase
MKKNQQLKYEEKVAERIRALSYAHMHDLNTYVERIRSLKPNCFVPDFDPFDGGVNAKILFLLEKPGPRTDRNNGGSGFVSRDNDDMTAYAINLFLSEIDINRKDTIFWNLVPIWNGTRKTKMDEILFGSQQLVELFSILKNLKIIVLVGKKAQHIYKFVDLSEYKVFKSFHPSPIVKAAFPDKWNDIQEQWLKIKKIID